MWVAPAVPTDVRRQVVVGAPREVGKLAEVRFSNGQYRSTSPLPLDALSVSFDAAHVTNLWSWRSVDPQLEDVRARIVACNVQLPARSNELIGVNFGIEDRLHLFCRAHQDLSIRVCDE